MQKYADQRQLVGARLARNLTALTAEHVHMVEVHVARTCVRQRQIFRRAGEELLAVGCVRE